MAATKSWRMLCSHGAALVYVARHPGCTVEDIAGALVISPKTAWRLVRQLRRSHLVNASRRGRQHLYRINPEGQFPDPVLGHLTIGQLAEALA